MSGPERGKRRATKKNRRNKPSTRANKQPPSLIFSVGGLSTFANQRCVCGWREAVGVALFWAQAQRAPRCPSVVVCRPSARLPG